MCKFFSCVSDGVGNIKHFTPEQVAGIMASGNPNNYRPNSHSSILAFYGILGSEEDLYNKWEYEIETKTLNKDQLNNKDDSKEVKIAVEAFLAGKNLTFLRNLYGMNTGDQNTGDQNTGHQNTGHWNTGDQNTGHQNTGDQNTGHRNTGDRNTGHQNTGHWNTGHWNTGHQNTGDQNTGDQNTGHWNSGNYNPGFFNTDEPTVRMFNRDTGKTFEEIGKLIPQFLYALESPTEWVWFSDMTDQEKIDHPKAYVNDGYLRTKNYKECWARLWDKANARDKAKVKALPNFDADLFFQITGIKV